MLKIIAVIVLWIYQCDLTLIQSSGKITIWKMILLTVSNLSKLQNLLLIKFFLMSAHHVCLCVFGHNDAFTPIALAPTETTVSICRESGFLFLLQYRFVSTFFHYFVYLCYLSLSHSLTKGFYVALRLVACAQSGQEVSLSSLNLTVPAPKFVSLVSDIKSVCIPYIP